jgi:hypothetical protein
MRPCVLPGMRAHPEHWPVNPPNKYLRQASDAELADYYTKHGAGDDQASEQVREHVFAELQRRDLADERKRRRADEYRARVIGRKTERAAEVSRVIDAAEAGTNGYILNRRGREAGISERSLFTGPEARAKKYASEELLNWWESHPRPTEAHFRGEDTRIGYATVRGKRPRMTSEEEAWRDRYERDIGWPIEHGPHAEAA